MSRLAECLSQRKYYFLDGGLDYPLSYRVPVRERGRIRDISQIRRISYTLLLLFYCFTYGLIRKEIAQI